MLGGVESGSRGLPPQPKKAQLFGGLTRGGLNTTDWFKTDPPSTVFKSNQSSPRFVGYPRARSCPQAWALGPRVCQALAQRQEDLRFCDFSGTCRDLSPFPAQLGIMRSNSELPAGGGGQPRLAWVRPAGCWSQWGMQGVC